MIPAHDYVTPWLDGGRPSFDNSGITAVTAAATLNTRITSGGFSPIFTRNGTNGIVFKTGNTPANLPVGNLLNTVSVVGLHTKAAVLQEQAYEWSLVRPEVYNPAANIYGDGNQVRRRGRVLNAFVEQKITEHFYVETGAMKERSAEHRGSWVDGNNSFDLNGDGNRFLEDGATLNPNFGKLYSQSNPLDNRSFADRQELRLTVSYDLKFSRRRGLAAWLGRHRIGAMVSDADSTTVEQGSRLLVAGTPSFLSAAARTKLGDASRLVYKRTYLGNGVDHVSSPVPGGALDFNPVLTFTRPAGERFEARMYDHPDGSYPVAGGRSPP